METEKIENPIYVSFGASSHMLKFCRFTSQSRRKQGGEKYAKMLKARAGCTEPCKNACRAN